MATILTLRPQFSANVNAKDGSVYTIQSGGDIVDPITGKPLELADGELDRLSALGAFDEVKYDSPLVTVGGVVNQPTAQLASNTAPEGEEVDTPSDLPVEDEKPAAKTRR